MKAMICESGGGISSDELTAINFNVLEGKTAVTAESDDEIATGTMPDRTKVDSSTGGINSNYPNTSIWKASGGIQFNTSTKGERLLGMSPQTGYYVGNGASYVGYKARSVTLTPSATQQSVSSDTNNGVLETVTVPAVSNLSAGNIKAGVTVGGVAGTFTNDANAVAAHLLANETAYVKGSKITGTMINRSASTTAVSYSYSGSNIYFRIPMGAYITADTNGTYPTIAAPFQDKTATPTKSSQTISADSGKVLRNVTINAIPGEYITTSDANATAAQILTGRTAYVNGSKITGAMANIAAVDTAKSVGWDNDYGYIRMTSGAHITNATSGYPEVKVPYQNVTVTPTKSQQTISSTDYSGKVLGNVFINAIPSSYITTSDANATASQILTGRTAYVNGSKITGSMSDRRTLDSTIGGINSSYPNVSVQKASNLQFAATTKGTRYGAMSGPTGYYENGASYVGLPAQSKTITPSTYTQTAYADSGKILESVTIDSIPDNYMRFHELSNFNFTVSSDYPTSSGSSNMIVDAKYYLADITIEAVDGSGSYTGGQIYIKHNGPQTYYYTGFSNSSSNLPFAASVRGRIYDTSDGIATTFTWFKGINANYKITFYIIGYFA